MMVSRHATGRNRLRLGVAAVATTVVVSAVALVATTGSAQAAAVVPPLGTTESFGVLAGSGITNTGPTTITGDIGSFPNPAITGSGLITLTGTNYAGGPVTQGAKDDLVTTYNNLAAQLPRIPVTDDLAGDTLPTGVYNATSAMSLTGQLTLDAEGDPDAVFVFQAGSTLITGSAASVVLIGGAQACNVFWQVGSSATLGTSTAFVGTIVALTSITLNTTATIQGRALARNGAVTMDTNTITVPRCAAAPPTTPPPSTPPTTPPTPPPTGPAPTVTPPPTGPAPTVPTSPPTGPAPTAPPTGPAPTAPPTAPAPTAPPPTSVDSTAPTGPAPTDRQSTAPTTGPGATDSPAPGSSESRAPQVTRTPRGSVDTGDASGGPLSLSERVRPTSWFEWVTASTP